MKAEAYRGDEKELQELSASCVGKLGGALFVENSEPIIKQTKGYCAFYHHHVVAVLNIIDDKTFLP